MLIFAPNSHPMHQYEDILTYLISAFFILNALNHFFNGKALEDYALGRGYLSPSQAVKLAGIMLLLGGLAFLVENFRPPAAAGLALFLAFAALTVHKFWEDTHRRDQQRELLRFIRNFALAGGLLFLVFQ